MNTSWISSFNNNSLELTLFVTEQCNFRCIYCYENFKLGKISLDIVEGIKKLILKRISKLNFLTLSFFGGEPLLNKELVIELSEWAKNICKINNVTYIASITTNGYLLNKNTFKKLIKNDIFSYQITLDGNKETHNKFRPTSKGEPTFERIYSNMAMMVHTDYDFECLIRFNLADTNFDSLKSFINDCSSLFTNDKRFSFHFHPIFGNPQLRLTQEKQLDELKYLAEKKGFKYDIPSDHPLCYASKANNFSIRADGTIQKCTVALENEMNNIGKIDKKGNLNLNETKLRKWIFANNKQCPLHSIVSEESAQNFQNTSLPLYGNERNYN